MARQWFARIRNLGTGRLALSCLPSWWQNCPPLPPFLRIRRTANGVRAKLSLIRQLRRGEIKRKRGWEQEHGRGVGRKREAGRGRETRIYPVREYNGCCTSGRHFWRRVLFPRAAYVARQNRQATENVFYFSKRDVWRQFHCAFHSVGRFEIQARIPFVPEQRGDKGGDDRGRGRFSV